MHSWDLPAGSLVRLTATARSDTGLHRWEVRLITTGAASGAPRVVFGSHIGERDLDQRIEIPPQDADCRVEARSSHAEDGVWIDGQCTLQNDTPDELRVAFCNPARSGAQEDDVLLSFAIRASHSTPGRPPSDGQP